MQSLAEGVTSAIYTKRGARFNAATDARYLTGYNDWQAWARRYARTVTAASFQALVIADLCSRCDTFIEARVDGKWQRMDDPRYANLMERYQNPLQTHGDLIRLHAWRYQVDGEMLQTQLDNPDTGSIDYGIYSVDCAQWDKPDEGWATIRLTPDGKVLVPYQRSPKDTAFEIPRDQVVRFWMPDPDYQAFATSPMTAGIEDLHRYRALAKYATKVADSHVAMSGLMWFPSEAMQDKVAEDDLAEAALDAGVPKYVMQELYYQIASQRVTDSNDVVAAVPPLFTWDKEGGPPVAVDVGNPLDQAGIDHRREALEDFSRGTNLPNTTVLGGGVGDANHWSEWLASAKVWDSAGAPTMNRVCHLDLTRSFLWPLAEAAGYDRTQLKDLRIGYDATPVLIRQDTGELDLHLLLSGAISYRAMRAATDHDESDAMNDPEERQWLLEVLAHGRLATQPAVTPGSESVTPAGPANVSPGPPSAAGTPADGLALGASVNGGGPPFAPRPTRRRASGRTSKG